MDKKLLGGVAALAVAGLLTGATGAVAATDPAPGHHHYALGRDLSKPAPEMHTAKPVHEIPAGVALPEEKMLPVIEPGDQGQVGSCVAWATVHSGYGVLMNQQKIDGGPMAPMYIYAQIAKGNDQGTFGDVALDMLKEQGVDTSEHYGPGDFDYTTQPTQEERQNASKYKLSGYDTLQVGSGIKQQIKESINKGMPVAIGVPVHQSFMDIDAQTAKDYSYMPGDDNSDPVQGGHEIEIIGYSDQGVRIENSWGNSWGDGGFINVPWEFVETQPQDALAMGKIVQN